MKKRKVWRYTCDFCGKSNCGGGAIAKHERHCTMNPQRICRMCAAVGEKQTPIAELKDALWNGPVTDYYGVTQTGIEPLRIAAHNCPACILAALRQGDDKDDPINLSEDFSWKDERGAWIEDYHEACVMRYDGDSHFDREEWLERRAKRFAPTKPVLAP